MINRAEFLRRTGSLAAVAFLGAPGVRLVPPHCDLRDPGEPLEHPEPREGINAERVLTPEALASFRRKKIHETYDYARKFPAIFDGIACACACGGRNGEHRSLLVCFETKQATGCLACQEQAELVGKLAAADKPLEEIRKAVDKEYG